MGAPQVVPPGRVAGDRVTELRREPVLAQRTPTRPATRLRQGSQHLHIGAGAEAPPGSGQDDPDHATVPLGSAHRVAELRAHPRGKSVEGLRAVEGDCRHRIRHLVAISSYMTSLIGGTCGSTACDCL